VIGSPYTYDMVSVVVAYADEHMGQEEFMCPQQWFQAMSHVREQQEARLEAEEAATAASAEPGLVVGLLVVV